MTRWSIPRSLFWLVTGFLLLTVGERRSASQPVEESRVKAAFVMNFLKFVEWPPSAVGPAPAPLVVAVLGDDAFAEVLRQNAATESINGRPIVIRPIVRAEDALGTQLLFIAASERGHLDAILKVTESSALLTVGDTEGFAHAGVVLNLYTFDQRIRIEVNATAAARAGLRLSAHLLRIARIVA